MNTNKITIAATGLNGLVGSRVHELLHNSYNFISLSQKRMDITDKNSVDTVISSTDFDIFLHLAAYTNVDGAEKNPETAQTINVTGTKNVYEAVKHKKKKFIYISTDFVFDGENPPFDESSLPNPQCVYAQTKYTGEKVLGDDALIARISYPYRAEFEHKTDFVRSIIDLLQKKTPLTGVTDQILTLTLIDDIANALDYLFKNFTPGIIHLVGGNSLSGYEAMQLIVKTFSLDTSLITPTTYETFYKGRAKRPQYGVITSIKNNFYQMKTFEQGLAEVKKQMIA